MDIANVNGQQAKPGIRLLGTGGAASSESGKQVAAQKRQEDGTPATTDAVEQAVTTIEAFTQSISRNLNFSLDDSTGRVVVKVTDSASGEVIRQIPSEEALRLAESLEEARSLLFRAEA